MKRLFLLLCAVFWSVEGEAVAADQQKGARIGIADWAPYVDRQHIAFGLVPEIVQLAFLKEDIDIEFVFYDSWTACSDALNDGEIDASAPYTPTGERQKRWLFSQRPIVDLTTALFYLRNNSEKVPDANLFENQQAFAELTIAGMRGYFYEDMLQEIDLVFAADPYANFQKLYLGKVDAVIENELIGWHTLSQLFPYSLSRFAKLRRSTATHGGHLVVDKNNPQGSALLNTFDQGLEQLKESGLYGEVIKKYKEGFKRTF